MMKNKWLPFSLIVILSVMIFRLFSGTQTLFLDISNGYFMISLILLVIGLFGWVLKEGTFDLFHYSLNQLKDKLFNQGNSKTNKKGVHYLSQAIPSTYTAFIKAGLLFLVCSILCILIYFIF